MEPLLLIVAMGAIFYFLMIRPQQKRMKAHQATISELAPGTRVLLTSGVFATVRHLGEKQAIVELAPGVEITIVKGNIARPTTPDEEEFEFSDDVDVEAVSVDAPENGMLTDEVLLPEDNDDATASDETFDPRGDQDPNNDGDPGNRDISPEELQRRFDN